VANIWALGCILFAMLTVKMPFGMPNAAEIFKKQILRQVIFPHHPQLYISQDLNLVSYSISGNCL
jgi:hypothetical protein